MTTSCRLAVALLVETVAVRVVVKPVVILSIRRRRCFAEEMATVAVPSTNKALTSFFNPAVRATNITQSVSIVLFASVATARTPVLLDCLKTISVVLFSTFPDAISPTVAEMVCLTEVKRLLVVATVALVVADLKQMCEANV